MGIAWVIWILLQVLIGYNLYLPMVLFIFFKKSKQVLPPAPEADYGVIVTAYEQTDTLGIVVASLLKLNYTNYLVYIVADKCDISNLHFEDERIILLRPPETLASNTRSHFYAINHFKRTHTRLTIIDSDNLVHPEYLHELDKYFDKGFAAVQGIREAKNLNTTFACLDAARDIYYHFYDGKVLFGIGSSATLAGSGMAFTTQLYRDCLENKDITGAGFDKVLQSLIVGQNLRIAFTDKAIVYDEKTTHADQLVKQRSRWINTWFRYFKFGFSLVLKGITNFSRNQFVFGLILLRPPLFIFLILSVFCMLANFFISITAVFIWLLGMIVFVLGFYIALAKSDTDKRIYQSLINIP
jgi:cellulose synthase/poly-beta-1,6-N-acetylglucosamine synthase-like glycosyltransferase